MSSDSFTRYICWQQQPIHRVINKEAVSIDRTLFLATHAPFHSIRYEKSPQQVTDSSESTLLAELQERGTNDQHTFMVIQGIPGTGKSHLIRWLKERYAAENEEANGQDIVLLIERANSSLSQTLTQIIKSDLFNAERFREQLKKLEDATAQLSKDGLAETILNHLQVATYEVDIKSDTDTKSDKTLKKRLEKFLLDYSIREELKKEGGPIKRIMHFLSGRERKTPSDHELPSFKPEDFEISVKIRREIRKDGNRDTRKLAEKLAAKLKHRQELASYLNQLVPFAIQRTTAFSATDLKHMFDDLRRELKQQGKQLTLFIEDIAVFTGLDAGLIDVLVTQHTGESNREFCRLTSVVGITDNYYADDFPDNIKQRITHHLVLNKGNTRQQESHLLSDSTAVADLVARYLNVMRLPSAELEAWAEVGAKPDALPNACSTCAHRSVCHSAFGSVLLDEHPEHDAIPVGLYPFNENALWMMYSTLDTAKVSKTPRTLLNSVVEYVLTSHGSKVKNGEFPPVASQLGSDFEQPNLLKPTQGRLIRTQSRNSFNTKRIESLILFWGNRTIDQSHSKTGQRQVSQLNEAVFKAFDLPFIEGEVIHRQPSKAARTPNKELYKIKPPHKNNGTSSIQPISKREVKEDSLNQTASKKVTTPSPSPQPAVQPTIAQNPLFEKIERWRMGGQLEDSQKLIRWLADFVKDAIDWQAYQVSTSLVDHCFQTRRRFAIEGQSGKAQGDRLLFKRSDELAYVLHALAELRTNADTLLPEKIGIHSYTLNNWLRKEEARIVGFVRQPSSTIQVPCTLEELLVHNCLLIRCLRGEFVPSKTSSRELYFRLLKEEKKQTTRWTEASTQARLIRSDRWLRVMRAIDHEVSNCINELYIVMNYRQGAAKTIRYINAPRLLDLIDQFKKQKWVLPQLDLSDVITSNNKTWVTAAKTYQTLQQEFVLVLQAEQHQLQPINKRLRTLLGDDSPTEVFAAIADLLSSFRENQISHSFTIDQTLTGNNLSNRLNRLEKILSLSKDDLEPLALSLSGAATLIQDVKVYQGYLEQFFKLAQKQQLKIEQKTDKLEAEMAENNLHKQIKRHYQALDELLSSIL